MLLKTRLSIALTTAMALLASSISFAGPARLATSFFIPAGRTNPVVLDAKADANGNLVTAALADVTGGGQQIVITKFTAAGVRRWSSTINTPVPVGPIGQVAGKFQIQLDGVGNTYVLSPRAGNPVIADTTEDLIVRKISDTGATVGYLSLVGYLFATDGVKYNVTNAQMQTGSSSEEVGIAFTAVGLGDLVKSAIVMRFSGGVSAGAISVNGRVLFPGDRYVYPGIGYFGTSYSVVGLKEGILSSNPAGKPKYRLIIKTEADDNIFDQIIRWTSYEPAPVWFDPSAFDFEPGVGENRLGFEAEGLSSSPDQVIVFDRHYSGSLSASRLLSSTLRSSPTWSDAPLTATRVGDEWLVYHWSSYDNRESLFKLPTTGALIGTPMPITSTGTPLYAGASILTANGRAYLAGGPTAGGVQGTYSSFSAAGELVYSAGQTQPFALSTSIVVPTANNRFWTVGQTSTGLQAVTLWREPDYFVGISAPSSAHRGDTVTVKAHLNAPAPIGGYTFPVSVTSKLQNAPSTVTVGEGETSVTFTVKVKSTATAGSATVTARTNTTLDVNTAHTAMFNIH